MRIAIVPTRDKRRRTACNRGIIGVLAAAIMLWMGGCGDYFAEKPVEIQTEEILNEIRQIKENPNVDNPLPAIYLAPPEITTGKEDAKLFYFTRNHPPDKLAGLLSEQFGYEASANAATNQLIVKCPSSDEARAALDFLERVDVPPIQVNIDCIILERFADVTMDWETTLLIENLFGERITLGGKAEYSKLPDPDGTMKTDYLPTFPGASLRESKRSAFGFNLGYWRNQGVPGHQLRAIVDMLISRGYLKILMNPTLETVNGQKAKISSRDNIPIEKIVTERDVLPYSITEYQWVEDTLEVTPNVFADGSIGLATTIKLSSSSKPKGVVQVSIITERSIEVAENRIKPGDSLIIGGIRKTEERGVIRGVPFLKDIPIIGVLFSSKDFEESSKELIFILTPTISSGGVRHAEMTEEVRSKFARPKYEAELQEVPTEPVGGAGYTDQTNRQAVRAEFERLKAGIEKARTKTKKGRK